MIAPWKKKSAGIAVARPVHDLITQANAARNAKRWPQAFELYRKALELDPSLYHIWIQLGHASKEIGEYESAEAAYGKAAEVSPMLSEPHLHLGHTFKVSGRPTDAIRSYFEATRIEASNADAVAELTGMMTKLYGVEREHLVKLLEANILGEDSAGADESSIIRAQTSLQEVSSQVGGVTAEQRRILASAVSILGDLKRMTHRAPTSSGKTALIFDVSDLIGFYKHSRLPTGIQRVQIEAIRSALVANDRIVKVCCFIDGRDDWLEVPVAQLNRISQLSVKSGDRNEPEWTAAINRLHLTLALAEPFEFPDGAYLVNLGTSWWMQNYFLFVRHAKIKHGIRYIPFVHDFIPIITPEHCVKGLTQDFISWAVGVFEHADYYMVNSKATKRDLIKVASILGHEVSPESITIITLDADFRKPAIRQLSTDRLAKWRLENDPFILFVSTIESRKGHIVALDAWIELIRRHGLRKTPRLVCVGNKGWLNDAVYEKLEQNERLAKRVTMLSYLSDEELALLYRSSSFTIYPSLYEGWGLPITESFCYGKAVVASDSSSLPEAGGDFAVFVEAGSPGQLADAVEKLTFDENYLKQIEEKIAREFKPRSWLEIAEQIDKTVRELASKAEGIAPYKAPQSKLGKYHPITRNVATRIWPGIGSGEIFRTGLGWIWPDTWGCWTLPQGGGVTIGLPSTRGIMRVNLLLKGLPSHTCAWTLRVKGAPPLKGELQSGHDKWISFDYPVIEDGDVLRMHLQGERTEYVRAVTGGIERDYLVSIGLCGFFICDTADVAARSNFLEVLSLGNIDDLNAYRENEIDDADIDSAADGFWDAGAC